MNTLTNTAARSNLYGLLALGFRYPGIEERAFVANDRFPQGFRECINRCAAAEPAETEALAGELSEAVSHLDEIESDYILSFHSDVPEPSASLYESSYRPGMDKAKILLELRAFYDNFGLAVAPGLHELEDALPGELEFMHFLAAKEALAEIEGQPVTPYRRAQRDFLERHLSQWVGRFEHDVRRKSKSQFYRVLATATRMLVESDLRRLEDGAGTAVS